MGPAVAVPLPWLGLGGCWSHPGAEGPGTGMAQLWSRAAVRGVCSSLAWGLPYNFLWEQEHKLSLLASDEEPSQRLFPSSASSSGNRGPHAGKSGDFLLSHPCGPALPVTGKADWQIALILIGMICKEEDHGKWPLSRSHLSLWWALADSLPSFCCLWERERGSVSVLRKRSPCTSPAASITMQQPWQGSQSWRALSLSFLRRDSRTDTPVGQTAFLCIKEVMGLLSLHLS